MTMRIFSVLVGFGVAMALTQCLERMPVNVPPVDRGHPSTCEDREC